MRDNTFTKTRFHVVVDEDSEHEFRSLLHRLYNQLVTQYMNLIPFYHLSFALLP